MRRMLLLVSGVLICMWGYSIVSAHITPWRRSIRPKVELEIALKIALDKLPTEQVSRYCVGASLLGDATGEEQIGAWYLFFGAIDGSVKVATVNMKGQCEIANWQGPASKVSEGASFRSLSEIKTELEQLFASEFQDLSVSYDQPPSEILVIRNNVRQYDYYEFMPDGSFSDHLVTSEGPEPNGFLIEAKIINLDQRTKQAEVLPKPYWNEYFYYFKGSDESSLLEVKAKWGLGRLSMRLSNQILSLFGERISAEQ